MKFNIKLTNSKNNLMKKINKKKIQRNSKINIYLNFES